MLYFINCLKSLFADPRPYMVNTDIVPLEEYAEYGNPSGHVFIGYIWVTYIFETFIYCRVLHSNKEKD